MCFGFSKEPAHQNGSFENPQHMFWLRNKKYIFQLRTIIWGPGCMSLSRGAIENQLEPRAKGVIGLENIVSIVYSTVQ